jgi:hypothetical protein
MPTIANSSHAGLYGRRDVSRQADPSVAVRVRARLHRSALTESLSEGADPESSPELALRARQLVGGTERRILSRTLERTLDDVRRPKLTLGGGTLVRRQEVLRAQQPLQLMIKRLRDDRPVAVEGMALIERLITDGTWSPLYNATAPGALRRLTVLATAALEPDA